MSKYSFNFKEKQIIKYRYFLIAIILIIIALLMLLIFLVNVNHKEKEPDMVINEIAEIEEEKDDVMIIDLDEERLKQQEEEQNATGIVYLTFDDGPSADSTPQILDILKSKNIKATFFVLHYSEENEKLIKREQKEGHTIALHGYTHTYSELYQSADTCIENFRKIQNQVFETTGIKSNIIRFPGGSSNTISRKYAKGVMTELVQRVVDEGFKYYDWNVDSTDAARPKSSDVIYNNVISGIKPDRNNVVLMHDFAGNNKTIAVLEDIINYGLENGYVFRKLTEEVPMVVHGVNN